MIFRCFRLTAPDAPAACATRYLSLPLLLAVLAPDALAFTLGDPLDTDTVTPPRPVLRVDGQVMPCRQPSPGTAYGLAQVVDLALCQNPTTREVWAATRVEAAQVGLAQGQFLPLLDAAATASRLRSQAQTTSRRSADVGFSWLLFDFGARSANLEAARQTLAAAVSTLDGTVQTVFLAAVEAYYQAQAARAAVVAASESERASRESLTAAEVRYRVGTATPADRLQAQTAWSQATLTRIRAEGVSRNALGRLANVMGLDANHPVVLDDPPAREPNSGFESDVAALIAEARQRRPELKAAEADVKAAEANIDYALASGLPTLSVNALRQWQDPALVSGQNASIGLTLSVPIFSGFNTLYSVRAARARRDVSRERLDNVRLQVALDVWQAYQNLQTATQTTRTSTDLLASAEQSERVALGRYKAGVGTILDVLNAQSALANARLQRIQATLDWQVSRATLARSLGALDGSLLETTLR
ncbi:TolC family protein [Accumulibacter sp.]|uniref:TolC family protein n=1 Tax=Accumulibacter sp. TaxID=2053492 RepID=UPI0025EFB79C|nr:TolC family protein [Accumulibacter sp.]MCM8596472.1 TolC family protein [Accumulibacter sp.]MCM8627356.1 TolC family protein [Accumulibacter sp.]MDS4050620.1 TolC family protein [Accumulibacter sp.]